jgi:hypothetical protein
VLVSGWSLEVHHLAIAKLVAGRQKEIDFLTALRERPMAELPTLQVKPDLRPLVSARLTRYVPA